MTPLKGRVLAVAGSDSGGGAGIQADIRAVTRLGGFAMTAITAITAQDTLGVSAVQVLPAEIVQAQMRVVLEDIGADAIKIGMLANGGVAEAVADILDSPLAAGIPVVLDTVITSKSGATLLDAPGLETLRRRLLRRAVLITPNLPEAQALSGLTITDVESMARAAERLLAMGAQNVLLKGGHLQGDELVDILAGRAGRSELRHPRRHTRHTHGTGCTLSSAIATGLAQGQTLNDAVRRAVDYVQDGIRNAPGFGRGSGPLG